jgi:copper homeostasis protein
MKLEICVDSVESSIAAASGGAHRIELCSALSEGGITPSSGLIDAVRKTIFIDVFVIIRPRGGDFVYSDFEFEVMRNDICIAKQLGANGVVLGLLTAEGRVDKTRTRSLIELARPMQVTFHRAFDVAINLEDALEDVIACGVDRILTSGGEVSAQRGVKTIATLNKIANGRIHIMAGGSIRVSNVRAIVQRSGVNEVHTSLSTKIASTAQHGNQHVHIGSQPHEFTRYAVLEEDVRAMKSTLEAVRVEKRKKSSD